MLIDKWGRKINYLRVSVTDKCNLRCIYCMPPEGIPLKPHSDILRYEEIEKIVSTAAELGIDKIRITGGEPLVKKNIEYLVSLIYKISGIKEINMTTNASLLTYEKASALAKAGLSRINISLDTLNPEKYSHITRGGSVGDVLNGIKAAKKAGIEPVKINMVVSENMASSEIEQMRDFCSANGLLLQTIRQFSLYDRAERNNSIPTDRPPNCVFCNRLRLTSDGYIKPCLFSDKEIKVDFSDIRKSILTAVSAKPENGASCRNRTMSQIGG